MTKLGCRTFGEGVELVRERYLDDICAHHAYRAVADFETIPQEGQTTWSEPAAPRLRAQ